MRLSFVDGQVLMWPKGKTIDDAVLIGEQEGGLYKLKGDPEQALVHDKVELNEICHRMLAHVRYKALRLASKYVEVFHKFRQNMMESAKDVQKERTQRRNFQVAIVRQKESWKSFTPMYLDQCH